MTPLDRVDSAINDAASRLTSATPSDALRMNVMSRISHLRASRFGGQAGFARWRYLFAGGAIASVALIALVSGPFNPTIPNPTISNPTVINPTVVKPALAHPTAASQVSSPIASVNYAISTAEIEWRARATPALDLVEPLEMKSLELKSIDITPLGVAPLMVSALGDGSNW